MTASGVSEGYPLPETYSDCLRFLYGRNQFAMKLGLDNINGLLDRLGRPDAGMVFVHVAGTNGKGSVCSNLAALLSAAGYARVGLYTSPHLVSFRERIRVDGAPIPREWIVDWLRRAMVHIREYGATYFECATAMALDYFRSRACGAVVLETGLGGRLDATNAVRPALTVVTSVSLDHTAILGSTVEGIWGEKIGILKPGVPMVVGEDRPLLLGMLEEKARAARSPVFALRDFPARREEGALRYHGRFGIREFPPTLRTETHQVENLALSLLALETFLDGPLPPSAALAAALEGSRLPGRTQLLEEPGRLSVLLDGAHNPGGMEALATYLRGEFPGRRILAVFSMMRDKDYPAVYRSVLSFASEILFVSLDGKFPRALPYGELAAALEPGARENLRLFVPGAEAWDDLLRIPEDAAHPTGGGSGGPPLVVVCGSLYLLGEVIPMLLPHYRGLEGFRQFEGES